MINKLRRKGQALVMVTFALVAMIGIVGLAVDFSFAYFLEKTMQAGADSAALAAVQKARETAGGSSSLSCSTVDCYPTPTSCSSITSGTAQAGCQYAAQNGFPAAEVTIEANAATSMTPDATCTPSVTRPPTAGCVDVLYYVTARISRRVPQLFSSILGNTQGGVASRATAAVAQSVIIGSLILLNRNNDLAGAPNDTNIPGNGTNLDIQGGGNVTVPGGIVLGSTSTVNGREAGRIQSNSGSVVSPFTLARASNVIGGSAYQNWTCVAGGAYCPPTVTADGDSFVDPFDLKSKDGDISGQPPIYGPTETPGSGTLIPVPGGVLTTAICPVATGCPPGIYYATQPDCGGCVTSHPSGEAIRTGNNATINFAGGGAFSRYMFVGGLQFAPGTTATMAPGRYVFAGVLNSGDPVFQTTNNVTLTGGSGSDAGRLMIFTDFRSDAQRTPPGGGALDVQSYGGNGGAMEAVYAAIQAACGACNWNLNPWANGGLRHGPVDIQGGNSAQNNISLYGLRDTTGLPAELKKYGELLMWQDQNNSYVWYDQNGRLDPNCGGQNSPCANTPSSPTSPMLSIWASPRANYNGIIYQPRGAWTKLQGSGAYSGPLRIVTGAMMVTGTPQVTLTSTSKPITTYRTALVE